MSTQVLPWEEAAKAAPMPWEEAATAVKPPAATAAPVISRNPRTGLPQTLNDVTGIPTAATAVGSLAGPEGAAAGAGAGTAVDEMLHGTPAGDAAWTGAKNALFTELGGRGAALIGKFGAPLLNKIVDVLDEYEMKLPKTPSVNPLSYVAKKAEPIEDVAARRTAMKVAQRASDINAGLRQPKIQPTTPPPMFGGTSTAAGSLSDMANGFKLPPIPETPAPPPAAIVPRTAQEIAPKARTIFVPMKSTPLPESAKPGDLWTIPREKLVDLAKSGNADAATVLQRLGHRVIFVPNPAE